MNYARFLRLRRPIWDDFESSLAMVRARGARVSFAALEQLTFRYRQILHDHALAAARFPGTEAAQRLLGLALEGTHWLHSDRADRAAGPISWLTRSFKAAFRRLLPSLGVTTALFFSAAMFGYSLAMVQPGLGVAFLGPSTLRALEEGRLWTESLTTTIPPTVSSSVIATNNIAVAIAGWAGGALAGLGALYIILMNGFMLGALLGVTTHYSLATRLLEFVAAHGPLEITLVLVTTAAGLSMGKAMLLAEDRPRREVIGVAARDALVILIGCIPWIILLGFIEGFLSPVPDVDPWLKLSVGCALEALFLTIALMPAARRIEA